MAHDEPRESDQHDDPTAIPVVIAGVVGALLIVVTVIALAALTNRTERGFEQQMVVDAPSIDIDQLNAQQEGNLHTPRWVDKENGIVSIPIDEAIKLVSRELATSTDGTGPWSPRPKPATESQPSTADSAAQQASGSPG